MGRRTDGNRYPRFLRRFYASNVGLFLSRTQKARAGTDAGCLKRRATSRGNGQRRIAAPRRYDHSTVDLRRLERWGRWHSDGNRWIKDLCLWASLSIGG